MLKAELARRRAALASASTTARSAPTSEPRKFPSIRQQIVEIEKYKRDLLRKKVALGEKQVLPSKFYIRRKKELMVMNAALKIQHKQMTGSTVGR